MSEILRLRSPTQRKCTDQTRALARQPVTGGKLHAVHGPRILLLSLHRRSLVPNLEVAKSPSATR